MKVLIIFFFNILAFQCFSQVNENQILEIDDRLKVVYDQTYLENVKESHPILIQRLNYYLDNAFYITEIPQGKEQLEYSPVHIDDINQFNILLLEKEQNIGPSQNKIAAYRINGSNQLLVYHSSKQFYDALNKSLGRIK